MILVCGLLDEPVTQTFVTYLSARKLPYLFVDERQLGSTILPEYTIAGGVLKGTIKYGKWAVDINELTGAFNRTGMQERPSKSKRYKNGLRALEILLNLIPCKVANRPYTLESNSSKPSQFDVIIEAGLRVPDSYMGFAAAGLRQFRKQHHEIIVKSVSSVRSLVRRVDATDMRTVMSGQIIPHQYQECLEGTNVRAHVTGDRIFACEMITETLDYRYAGKFKKHIEFKDVELPQDVAAACFAINKKLDLLFSGIDLFKAGDKWYCFEVNTSPGYTWFEEHSGQLITEYLTKILLSGY